MTREGAIQKDMKDMTKEQLIVSLMEQYGDNIMQLAFTYVKQNQIAEDITQEVFIKCYEKIGEFRNESSYKTWLYRITVNKCKDVLKSYGYRNLKFFEGITEKLRFTEKTPEVEIIQNEESLFISHSVLKLPIKYREVIILYYFEDLTLQEISELLELNISTVKTRLHRARHLLKQLLKEV